MHSASRRRWRSRLARRPDILPFWSWLWDSGSLTTRLQRHGRFSVQLLTQRLSCPTRDEAVELGIAANHYVRIREVALFLDGQPVVFAHTALPTTPRGTVTRWLARLGNRSLGSMLFSHPEFTRGPLAAMRLDTRHPLHASSIRALQLPATTRLWARRSLFRFKGQSILVTEVFSPRLAESIPSVTKTAHRKFDDR